MQCLLVSLLFYINMSQCFRKIGIIQGFMLALLQLCQVSGSNCSCCLRIQVQTTTGSPQFFVFDKESISSWCCKLLPLLFPLAQEEETNSIALGVSGHVSWRWLNLTLSSKVQKPRPTAPSHTDTLDRLNAIVCFRKCQVKG